MRGGGVGGEQEPDEEGGGGDRSTGEEEMGRGGVRDLQMQDFEGRGNLADPEVRDLILDTSVVHTSSAHASSIHACLVFFRRQRHRPAWLALV